MANRIWTSEEYRREYLPSDHWRDEAWKAKERAGHRCQINSKHAGTLHAHHRDYQRLYCELPEDIFVLCDDCHVLHEAEKQSRKNGRGGVLAELAAMQAEVDRLTAELRFIDDEPTMPTPQLREPDEPVVPARRLSGTEALDEVIRLALIRDRPEESESYWASVREASDRRLAAEKEAERLKQLEDQELAARNLDELFKQVPPPPPSRLQEMMESLVRGQRGRKK